MGPDELFIFQSKNGNNCSSSRRRCAHYVRAHVWLVFDSSKLSCVLHAIAFFALLTGIYLAYIRTHLHLSQEGASSVEETQAWVRDFQRRTKGNKSRTKTKKATDNPQGSTQTKAKRGKGKDRMWAAMLDNMPPVVASVVTKES